MSDSPFYPCIYCDFCRICPQTEAVQGSSVSHTTKHFVSCKWLVVNRLCQLEILKFLLVWKQFYAADMLICDIIVNPNFRPLGKS